MSKIPTIKRLYPENSVCDTGMALFKTHARPGHLVMRAIDKLHAHQVPFHALCVVNSHNSKEPLKVYRFLKDVVRPRMIQFLSAVEPTNFTQSPTQYLFKSAKAARIPTQSIVTDWSIHSDAWGDFLCAIWQE